MIMSKVYRGTIAIKVRDASQDNSIIEVARMKYEQVRNRDGSYDTTIYDVVSFITVQEWAEREAAMMKNIGIQMSD